MINFKIEKMDIGEQLEQVFQDIMLYLIFIPRKTENKLLKIFLKVR